MEVNIDGSFDYKTRKGRVGGLFRDNKGNCIRGFHGRISVNNPLEAELTALYFGLKITLKMALPKLVIATDSILLASMFNNLLNIDNPADTNLIHMCRNLLQMLGNTLVYHEGRTSNRAADRLAKEGRRMNNNQLFEEWTVTPLFIYRTIDIDKEATYFDGSLQTVLMNARNITSTACNIATNYNNSVPQSMTVAMYDAY